jgi:hypothetical protein
MFLVRGFGADPTDMKAMTEATRSIDECIASEMILTEPLKIPAMTFIMMRPVFDATDTAAILTLLLAFFTAAPLSKKNLQNHKSIMFVVPQVFPAADRIGPAPCVCALPVLLGYYA